MIRSTIPPKIRRTGTRGAATLLGALALTPASRADVTVTAQVAVTEVVQPALDQAVPLGAAPPQRQESSHSPQTVTTYYKGGRARTESSDGAIVLYDGPGDKIYTLDSARKTYYVRSYKETLEPPQVSAGGPGGQPKVDASIDFKPGNETRTFAGAASEVYTVSGVVTITPQRRGFGGERGGGAGGRRHGRGGGGFPGGGGGGFPLFQRGGGYPGGGGPNGGYPGGPPNGGGRTRSIEVSGEFWLSGAVKLPDDKKASALPALQAAISGGDLALKPLADNLNKKKDIPLDSRLTLTHTVPRTGAQDSVTTTMQVTSVTANPLSDALFRLPLGYTQVAPPAPAEGDADGVPNSGSYGGRSQGG